MAGVSVQNLCRVLLLQAIAMPMLTAKQLLDQIVQMALMPYFYSTIIQLWARACMH